MRSQWRSLETHGYAADPSDAAYKAITAGLNMDMASQTYTHNLAKLVSRRQGSGIGHRQGGPAHPRAQV